MGGKPHSNTPPVSKLNQLYHLWSILTIKTLRLAAEFNKHIFYGFRIQLLGKIFSFVSNHT